MLAREEAVELLGGSRHEWGAPTVLEERKGVVENHEQAGVEEPEGCRGNRHPFRHCVEQLHSRRPRACGNGSSSHTSPWLRAAEAVGLHEDQEQQAATQRAWRDPLHLLRLFHTHTRAKTG